MSTDMTLYSIGLSIMVFAFCLYRQGVKENARSEHDDARVSQSLPVHQKYEAPLAQSAVIIPKQTSLAAPSKPWTSFSTYAIIAAVLGVICGSLQFLFFFVILAAPSSAQDIHPGYLMLVSVLDVTLWVIYCMEAVICIIAIVYLLAMILQGFARPTKR